MPCLRVRLGWLRAKVHGRMPVARPFGVHSVGRFGPRPGAAGVSLPRDDAVSPVPVRRGGWRDSTRADGPVGRVVRSTPRPVGWEWARRRGKR